MVCNSVFVCFFISLGDPGIDWEESVYLNLILHQVRNKFVCIIENTFSILFFSTPM